MSIGHELYYRSEGGFILIIEDDEDYQILTEYNVDLNTQVAEWTEVIQISAGD